MFKHYFEQVQNIGIFPVISLIIFFSFFVILIIWLTRLDKKHVSDMRHLPLDLDTQSQPEQNLSAHQKKTSTL
ncbi:cytochrome C oxidase Cbb3 [marine bacterium AO1-C]|nr:cytochrome C oxidase Cbb3 [marine bacterium AO1-C]